MTTMAEKRPKSSGRKPKSSAGNAGAGSDAPESEKLGSEKTGVLRAPLDIKDMLETIAKHNHNGWESVAQILNAPSCPLRDWLVPIYAEVAAEITRRAEEYGSRADS